MEGTVLEGRVALCDAAHNLHIDLPCMKGIIPREEGAIGIADGTTRDIALISRVGKAVCFTVMGFENTADGVRAVLSRRLAQEACRAQYFTAHRTGDVIRAKVTRLESFGAFCDIGCGVTALMPIAGMSVSRISHPRDRLRVGMDICAAILSMQDGRICLSQRELLGTWEENVARFSQGETVMGIVRSIEPYGVFIELAPNLAGLAEPREDLSPGQTVSVYIKSILPDKMKVKLIVIDVGGEAPPPDVPAYYITQGHLDNFVYSPLLAERRIEMVF
jgi:small subunit ribosomal protein S1